MNELKHYDKAAQEFYGSQFIKGLPIASWDSYALYFDKLSKAGRDIAFLNRLAKNYGWRANLNLNEELVEKEHVIVVTDDRLRIVHATHNIVEMNGYKAEDLIGESPKMFQGKDTCKKTSNYISKAIKNRDSFEAVVLNYRKDGTPYRCWIKGEPLFNESGRVVHFIAYEKEVA
ncbi:PAS domain-containing protein [Flavobacteriaceae bacterium TP-CH-4]|uniref:PAS domain-containing protein n=1 Tax=Pelagihabitans pacificus TaxID=2696054 RepID=A0A967AWI5_9FLAO|nr:PAS domain-containing protein [Pelagihabitans pacificus]NHF58887.1 PAS domain-containing protein [Pelagihabitans pacificus]